MNYCDNATWNFFSHIDFSFWEEWRSPYLQISISSYLFLHQYLHQYLQISISTYFFSTNIYRFPIFIFVLQHIGNIWRWKWLGDDDDDNIAVMEPKFKMVVVGGGATGSTAERESAGPPPQVSPDLIWSAILNLALVSYLIFRWWWDDDDHYQTGLIGLPENRVAQC